METAPQTSSPKELKVINVKERLNQLSEWSAEMIGEDRKLESELFRLSDKKQDIQRGRQIMQLRKAALYRLIQQPLYFDYESILQFGLEKYRADLANQYTSLGTDEKMLWLNNLLFISTPKLQELGDKIDYLLNFKSFGQGRNLLLAGLSGTGKSTFLYWKASQHPARILEDHNEVPIAIAQCPVNNKSTKYLLQRIINSTGKVYYAGDNEEELFDKAVLFLQMVRTKLLILDEITQLKVPELRRKVLEISNEINICILGSAVDPEKFTEEDLEIAGRFNDVLPLPLFSGMSLPAFLAVIDLILPFPLSSELHAQKIVKNKEEVEGPSEFIYRVTSGVLRDMMRLIYDASVLALNENEKCISLERLKQAWSGIQHRKISTLHDEILAKYKYTEE